MYFNCYLNYFIVSDFLIRRQSQIRYIIWRGGSNSFPAYATAKKYVHFCCQLVHPSMTSFFFFSDEFEIVPEEDEDGNRTKSVFVKVPLKANNEMEALMYRAVNQREKVMLTQVLPKLQSF